MDLVEVAPNASPPVCRLMDYGKFRYEQSRKERDSRRNQHVTKLKEVRVEPKIGDHDLETKGRQAARFLDGGDKVKLTVLFRGVPSRIQSLAVICSTSWRSSSASMGRSSSLREWKGEP